MDFKIAEMDRAKDLLKGRLSSVNGEIADIEAKSSEGYRRNLGEQLRVKEEELVALEKAKPAEVPSPVRDGTPTEEARKEAADLSALETQLTAITTEVRQLRDTRADHLKRSAHFNRILQAVKNYEMSHGEFIASLAKMLAEAGIDIAPQSIVSMTVDTSAIQTHLAQADADAVDLERKLNDSSPGAVMVRRAAVQEALASARGRLSERERRFVEYQQKLTQWEAGRQELIGDATKTNSIEWLKEQIRQLDDLPARLTAAQARRMELVRQLHATLRDVVSEYQKLYGPVRHFLQSPDRQGLSLDLDFKVRIVENGFRERFLDAINRNVRGTFSGIDESAALVGQHLEATDFEDIESVITFLSTLDDMLHFDRRQGVTASAISVPTQLRRGYTAAGVYDVLFGLDYLLPQYSLTFNAQEISQLSPGERGLLLLVFYLLVDKDNIPLVIDQPEENLDNQTIFHVLVNCIRAAKQRRQIVMVTHNPNLAVVCDAEQVIAAECDKVGKRFRYATGAIEDGDTNSAVVRVLEGTEPAFINRKTKYGL